MKAFEALDLFQIEDELLSEEKILRDSVRRFVSDVLMPLLPEAYDEGRFPKEILPQLGELGVLGANLTGYDCAGVSATAYGLIMHEIERGDSGIRSFVSVQGALCMYPIWRYGSEAQKQKYLPGMAKAKLIGCFGLTEPDFGSNPGGMLTKVRRDGDDYILTGTKMWITNGGICDLAIVWGKDEAGEVIGLIVDRETPGFTTKDIGKKFSLRASVTSELHFDQCRVPVANQLQVKGLRGPLSCLNQARYGIAWGTIGAAQACFDEALQYAKTRIQFDRPIGQFQLVQAKLANMATEITKAQWLTLRLGRLKDQNKVTPDQISMCKMNNVAMALNVARTCRDILGANGITYEYQVGRHLLNLESVNTYEGTEDIHRLVIGEKLTGLSAFK